MARSPGPPSGREGEPGKGSPTASGLYDDATATMVRAPRKARPLGAVVRVVDAKATPPAFRLGAGTCIVGSAPTCDIVINAPTVSRQHAELTLAPEGVAVRDLGSRNGVYYLGQRVERIVLGFGGRLDVGEAKLSIEVDAEALTAGLSWDGDSYRGMIGASPPMRRLFAMLARLEGSLATVLVEGESGVGKELIARALHDGSPVRNGPFVVVNCGAISRDLVASELFGHKKGAFTGAAETRRGAFESADGGTLFLDEIGELPLEEQPMLLRALETGDIRPVGGDQARQVKVRIVAATNRNLEREAEEGRFREDLFYRLAVVRLDVPPLRERVEDIAALAQSFAALAGLTELPADTLSELASRPWPGNVRELRNAVQAFAALGILPNRKRAGKATSLDGALAELVDLTKPYADLKEDVVDRFTRVYLAALLAQTGNNQRAAAEIAGLDRSYLGKLLAKHGIPRT